MVTRLATVSVGRRAMADQAVSEMHRATVEAKEALRYQEQARAVADLGAELISLARRWHQLADRFDAAPERNPLLPGLFVGHDVAEHLRHCAMDVERALQTAVRALEM